MASIQNLAKQAYDAFIYVPEDERSTGDRSRYKFNFDTPDWIYKMLSDDANLDFGSLFDKDTAREVLEAIKDSDEGDDIGDRLYEIEPDIYTYDLLQWLAEDINNVYYISEVLEEYGGDVRDGFQLLQMAQARRINEISMAIYNTLYGMAEEDDEEDEFEEFDEVVFIKHTTVKQILDSGDPVSLDVMAGVIAVVDYQDDDEVVLNLEDGTCIRAQIDSVELYIQEEKTDE